jgi:23S rRNA (adenine2030-N6)-methyltransferase
MNYRHAYHAGNHADVFKHITLSRIFALMARKDTPFAYLDSHSGIGLYDLLGDEASRTGEWESGIGRLWQRDDLPALAADYLEVRALNPDGGLEYYPGSPELARRLTRRRTACCSTSCTRKTAACSRPTWRRRIAVHQGDGWHCRGPCRWRRSAVLLIDPPFERSTNWSAASPPWRGHRAHAPDGGGDLVPDQG